MGMLVLIRYGLSVVVARFFFFLSFFFYLEKRREDCLGYDYYLENGEIILFYDN